MKKYCCKEMKSHIDCKEQDKAVYYTSKSKEYGIPVRDGYKGSFSSYIVINYCPWCGKKLPVTKKWFNIFKRESVSVNRLKNEKNCCDYMKSHIYYREQDMIFDDGDKEDKVIYYTSKSKEHGIPIKYGRDGMGTTQVVIKYCPWCGEKLHITHNSSIR